MEETGTNNTSEQEKEVLSILLDSALYLEMDLSTRYRLLHFVVASYFRPLTGRESG